MATPVPAFAERPVFWFDDDHDGVVAVNRGHEQIRM
jgi:hypothetical protein